MADGPVRRSLIRVINDDNLDLYLLGVVALVFTVLGATGISDVKTLSSVVLALLALLAFSQIRSRRIVEQIRKAQRGGADSLFARDFPADLITRRAHARDILLVGLVMARTVQGMRSNVSPILAAGGRIRVLVLDPTDEPLLKAADRRDFTSLGAGRLQSRIMATLDDLTSQREQIGGQLEIRVSSVVPPAWFNCLDTSTRHGIVCVQHYEYRPHGEAAPVFALEPSDGEWYQHFVAEAERLWDAGTEWPLSAADAAKRARRPAFSDEFGPELDTAVDEATELLITGTARHTLIDGSFGRLERKLRAGCRIRFLLVDPNSSAVGAAAERYYAERSADGVGERVQRSLRLLAELKTRSGGDLSVRLTSHPFAMTVIASETALFAEYFPYQDADTPKFVLRPGDAGHDRFLGEAETLWRNATPHEL